MVHGFNAKGEMTPTREVVLDLGEVERWRHAVQDATAVLRIASAANKR